MKKLNLNEEFSLEGQVYIFTPKEGGISLKRVRESKSKPSFIPPPLADVIQFFKEKGYTEQSAKRAYDYYSIADWKDSHGKQVKNWKQKCMAVWFKDEHKIQTQQTQGIQFFR